MLKGIFSVNLEIMVQLNDLNNKLAETLVYFRDIKKIPPKTTCQTTDKNTENHWKWN